MRAEDMPEVMGDDETPLYDADLALDDPVPASAEAWAYWRKRMEEAALRRQGSDK